MTQLLPYVKPGPHIDQTGETDMDVLGEIALGIVEKVREFDSRKLFEELAELCHYHPYKGAQLIMCFAAWFNPDDTTSTLGERAMAILDGRWAA